MEVQGSAPAAGMVAGLARRRPALRRRDRLGGLADDRRAGRRHLQSAADLHDRPGRGRPSSRSTGQQPQRDGPPERPRRQARSSAPRRSPAGTAGVQGTQYLSAGDYTFFCTVHPTTMQATLDRRPATAPRRRGRPATAHASAARSSPRSPRRASLVAVTASTKVDGASLTAKLGKATIGKAERSFARRRTSSSQTVKLSKAGKNKLKGKSKATVTRHGGHPLRLARPPARRSSPSAVYRLPHALGDLSHLGPLRRTWCAARRTRAARPSACAGPRGREGGARSG